MIKKIQLKPNMYIQKFGSYGTFHLAKECIQNSYDELEDKDTLLARSGEMVQENQELKDRIAELEKENDDYYERCVILRRENEQLKTLVSSLEKKNIDLEEYIKGNEQDAKAFVNGWHKDLEAELKQFAERLKEKYGKSCSEYYPLLLELTSEQLDETLKEFIK